MIKFCGSNKFYILGHVINDGTGSISKSHSLFKFPRGSTETLFLSGTATHHISSTSLMTFYGVKMHEKLNNCFFPLLTSTFSRDSCVYQRKVPVGYGYKKLCSLYLPLMHNNSNTDLINFQHI